MYVEYGGKGQEWWKCPNISTFMHSIHKACARLSSELQHCRCCSILVVTVCIAIGTSFNEQDELTSTVWSSNPSNNPGETFTTQTYTNSTPYDSLQVPLQSLRCNLFSKKRLRMMMKVCCLLVSLRYRVRKKMKRELRDLRKC